MSRLVRSLALAALGSILLSSSGYGQTAVVLQNANLRRDPSTAQAPIRLLQPQEQLQVLSLTPTSGYYNVATLQNEQGWVFGQFIEIDESQVKGRTNRNTNLRRDPSASQPAIRLMPPGEELGIIDAAPTANYYHVRTSVPEEGWAYQPYIDVVQVTPPPPPPPPDPQTPFPDARDAPTPGWNGPVFRLSQGYPDNPPPAENKPWKAFDFRTQADQYIRAVLAYAMEGNREVDWKGADNAVRKWYHAPWLHVNAGGREFVHGLTRERTSRPRELHPQQSSQFKNYAVGLYNPSAGYIVGRVWRDHENPDASAARFSDGAVGVKLLFTTATAAQVPYLANAFEWDAHVSLVGS
ncbi:MAG: SH3 domain-containing protein, partial [Burkholderiales bacterium]